MPELLLFSEKCDIFQRQISQATYYKYRFAKFYHKYFFKGKSCYSCTKTSDTLAVFWHRERILRHCIVFDSITFKYQVTLLLLFCSIVLRYDWFSTSPLCCRRKGNLIPSILISKLFFRLGSYFDLTWKQKWYDYCTSYGFEIKYSKR